MGPFMSAITVAALIQFIIAVLYIIGGWVKSGFTPGKKIMGLRIVNSEGQPPSVGQAILRYIGYMVSALPFYLGFFWILGSEKRGWHDMMAGTYVVKSREYDAGQ